MVRAADRLERALELFVAHRTAGGDWQELLRANPDLADVLVALRGDQDLDESGSGPREGTDAGAGGELLGDHRLGRIVGEGGISIVHEARDRLLGRRVAIKVLRPEFAASPDALARFRREAQTLARLDHPEVVRVLGVGDTGGRHWIAMEFVDGESLAARIDRLRANGGHTGDSLRQLVHAIARIAAALHHVHEAGIVHRDVKPSNILLRGDGSPVLTDFGIARDSDDPALTRTGVVLGSPRYMSPEQVLRGGAACDARSDVFSLGATLYECTVFQPAFAAASVGASLAAIVHDDPVDPRRLHRAVPADLAAIVMKAIEKEPARRYATARMFADDLHAFLDFREITARGPSRLRRWGRRIRRQPALGALVVMAALAVGLLVWIAVQWPQLRAASVAAQQREYDDAVVQGFLARDEADGGRPWFETAHRIDPTRSEALLGIVFSTSRSRGAAAALAELDDRAGDSPDENVARCRAWLLERAERRDEAAALRQSLGPPATSMGLWLEAVSTLAAREADADAITRARELLSLAVRISPQPNLLLHAQWAAAVCRGGDPKERSEVAETLLRLWPDRSFAVYLAGAALISSDPARAESLLLRAIELGGDDSTVLTNLGLAQIRRGERQAAIATLRSAFATSTDDGQRSRVLAFVGQVDPAASDEIASDWIESDANSPSALRFAGRAAWRRGEHEESIDLLRRAVAGLGGDFDTRLDLAFALVNGGGVPDAMVILRELIESRPDHERAHLQLLDAFDVSGDKDAALTELQRWAERRPDDPKAWKEYAAALSQRADANGDDRELGAAERADWLAGGRDDVARGLHATALERRGEDEAARFVRERPSRQIPK